MSADSCFIEFIKQYRERDMRLGSSLSILLHFHKYDKFNYHDDT